MSILRTSYFVKTSQVKRCAGSLNRVILMAAAGFLASQATGMAQATVQDSTLSQGAVSAVAPTKSTTSKASQFETSLASSSASASTGSVAESTASQTGSPVPPSYFGLTVHQSGLVPVVPYGTTRSWDAVPHPDWADSNPSPGVYDFTALDQFISANQATATTPGREMIYTLGRTPQWASSQPNAATDYGPGQCAPPTDINNWDNYVTAVVNHAAGAIKYWELWNEPMNPKYYCGDIPTMVKLAQHASRIIRSLDPTAVILSPAPTSGWGPAWLSSFLSQGGAATVDAIAFHGYWSQNAEDIVPVVANYRTLMAQNGLSSVPMMDTEASGGQMSTPQLEADFLSKYYLLHWSLGVSSFLWYGYDSTPQWGQLYVPGVGPTVAATAYAQTYDWMVGATLTSPCAEDSTGLWSCAFTRPGYEAIAMWNSTGTSTPSVLPQFVQYRDLQGVIHPIANQTVTVGFDPILVETTATESTALTFASISPQTFGAAAFPVYASSASNGVITYSVVSGPATISGTSVTLTGAGTVALGASQTASGNYKASTASASFSVAPLVPTLSFAGIANQTFGNPAFAVSATSASGGPVAYTVVSGPATISGSALTLTGAGSVVLSATQAANGNYAAATATTSFSVSVAAPSLGFASIAAPTYGDAPIQVSATSASSGSVTYAVKSGRAAISGSAVTLTGAGPVVLTATQAASGNYGAGAATTSFTVAPAQPTLTFLPVANQLYGNGTVGVRATSTSNGQTTYSIVSGPASISGQTITLTGTGTVVVAATQAATNNYTATTAHTSFNVTGKPTPTLTFSPVANQMYGNGTVSVRATSTSNGQTVYSIVSGPATISGQTVTLTGTGTVVVGAAQSATTAYGTATASVSFNVTSKPTPTLTLAAIADQLYGNGPLSVAATSTSNGQITYSIVSGPATISGRSVTLTGTGTVVVGATQATTTAYGPGTATTSFKVTSKSAPALAFVAIPDQMFGNGPISIRATSTSTGAIVYAVVSGPATVSGRTVTLTGTGAVVLSATQAASTTYSAATATTNFSVAAKAAPALTFAAVPDQMLGNGPVTVRATSPSTGQTTYAIVSGPATISGRTVTFTGIGTVVVSSTQAESKTYTSETATTNFKVTAKPNPTLSFAALSGNPVVNGTVYIKAGSESNGETTYSVVSGPATISGRAVSLTGTGTVVLSASQAETKSFSAAKATTSFVVNAKP